MDDVRKIFAKMLAEVKHTEATHTRNAGTDYRCRQVFVEHGDAILAALTPASDGRAEGLREAIAEGMRIATVVPVEQVPAAINAFLARAAELEQADD